VKVVYASPATQSRHTLCMNLLLLQQLQVLLLLR
jgi:hypothetical protein